MGHKVRLRRTHKGFTKRTKKSMGELSIKKVPLETRERKAHQELPSVIWKHPNVPSSRAYFQNLPRYLGRYSGRGICDIEEATQL